MIHRLLDLTPIHVAALRGSLQEVERALGRRRCDVNACAFDGTTALHAAAARFPLSAYELASGRNVVSLLLAQGADPNAAAKDGRTPLHAAAAHRHEYVAALLLSKGARVSATATNRATPLHEAFRVSDFRDLLRRFAIAELVLEDELSSMGAMQILERSAARVVEVLLEHGADLESRDENGRTPLHCASGIGDKEAIQLLLARGADPNSKAGDLTTALHRALSDMPTSAPGDSCMDMADENDVKQRLFDVVTMLLEAGADANAESASGLTPLRLARNAGDQRLLSLLVAHGAQRASEDSPKSIGGPPMKSRFLRS